jgi:uncharacterized protein
MEMKPIDKLAYLLMVIGGLNWGLVGFFKYNLVDKIFGTHVDGARVVYAVVGLGALWGLLSMLMMMSSMSSTTAKKKKK